MEKLLHHLRRAVTDSASDILIISGMPVSMRRGGIIRAEGEEFVMPDTADEYIRALYHLAGRPMDRFHELGDDDFPLSVSGLSRFRVSALEWANAISTCVSRTT